MKEGEGEKDGSYFNCSNHYLNLPDISCVDFFISEDISYTGR